MLPMELGIAEKISGFAELLQLDSKSFVILDVLEIAHGTPE